MKLAAILAAVGITLGTYGYLGLEADLAHAHVGVAVGPSFGVKSPLTAHAGPLYYHPGNAGRSDSQIASDNIDKALGIPADLRHQAAEARKLRCRELGMEYFWRHGFTTPTPLRGFHGCQKAAMDAAYWRHRRGEGVDAPAGPVATISQSINITLRAPLRAW